MFLVTTNTAWEVSASSHYLHRCWFNCFLGLQAYTPFI